MTENFAKCLNVEASYVKILLTPTNHLYPICGGKTLKVRKKMLMDLSTSDHARDELIKTNPAFRELVHQHQNYEQRLSELANLNYPSDDEQLEEHTLKKKKLLVKDEIHSMLTDYHQTH